jgi:hypothetical protein
MSVRERRSISDSGTPNDPSDDVILYTPPAAFAGTGNRLFGDRRTRRRSLGDGNRHGDRRAPSISPPSTVFRTTSRRSKTPTSSSRRRSANTISISDPDAEDGEVSVTFTVQEGTLALISTAGLEFVHRPGNGESRHFGTVAAINYGPGRRKSGLLAQSRLQRHRPDGHGHQ